MGAGLCSPCSPRVLTICCVSSVRQQLCVSMFVCVCGSENLLFVDSHVQACRLSQEGGAEVFSQPLCGSAGASDVGWRCRFGVHCSGFSPTDHSEQILLSLQEIQHLSVEAEHIAGALRAYSDSLPVLLLLRCLLLLLPLFSLVLIACSSLNMHHCQTFIY